MKPYVTIDYKNADLTSTYKIHIWLLLVFLDFMPLGVQFFRVAELIGQNSQAKKI